MNDYIIFIGKFDKSLLLLENEIINLGHQFNQNHIVLKYDSTLSPDIVKHSISGYNYDVYVILGDVKPTFLLNRLISRAKIIIFVFNFFNPETLDFLFEGWGHIIEKIEPKNQERILVGTQSEFNLKNVEMTSKISKIQKHFNCKNFFENKLFKKSIMDDPKDSLCEYIKERIQKKDSNSQIKDKLIEEKEEKIQKNKKIDKNDQKEVKKYEKFEMICQNNISYKISKDCNSAEIISYPDASGDVTIPMYIRHDSQPFFIEKIGPNAFSSTSMKSLSFAKKSCIKSIGNFAFSKSSISKLYIPASLTNLSSLWCSGAENLSFVEVNAKNKFFSIENNLLVFKKKLNKIIFAQKVRFGHLQIQSDISRIKNFAFYKHKGIQSISFNSSSFKYIDPFAFYKCPNLTKVTFLKTSESLKIGESAFSRLKNLTSVEFNCTFLTIFKNCFESCSLLNDIKFTNLKAVIFKEEVFKKCQSLLHLEMNKIFLIKIGKNCFIDANKLKTIKINSSIIIFCDHCFFNCSSLIEIDINCKKNVIIPDRIFEGCVSLQKVKIKTRSKFILNSDKFYGANEIKSIEITCKSIQFNENCFKNTKRIESLAIQSEKNLCINDVFVGCFFLKSLKLSSENLIEFSESFYYSLIYLKSMELRGKNVKINKEALTLFLPKLSLSITEFNDLEKSINSFTTF